MSLIQINKSGKITLIVIVAWVVLSTIYFEYLDKQSQRYTIGTVYDIGKSAKGGVMVYYEYYLNREKYRSSVSIYGFEGVAKIDEKFLVEYPGDFQWEGILLLDKPVPDSIEPPPEGWDEIPEFLK